jgi:hypothetical protein
MILFVCLCQCFEVMSRSSPMNANGNYINAWPLSMLVTVSRAITNLVRKILIAYVLSGVYSMLWPVHFNPGSVPTSFSLSRNNISVSGDVNDNSQLSGAIAFYLEG